MYHRNARIIYYFYFPMILELGLLLLLLVLEKVGTARLGESD